MGGSRWWKSKWLHRRLKYPSGLEKKWNKNIYGTWWQSSNILKLFPKITKTVFVKRHKDMVLRSSVNQIHDEYKSNNMGANHKTLTNKDKVETLKAYK